MNQTPEKRIDELPGYAKALEAGYDLLAYSGNKNHATYIKDGIYLDIWLDPHNGKERAKISAIVDQYTITTGEFSWPHNAFLRWETMVATIFHLSMQVIEREPGMKP